MNNTDIIKTDCTPRLPSCCYFAVRRNEAHGWWYCRSLTLLHSLWVSDWISAAPLSTYLPFICLVPRAPRLRWAQRLNCPNSKGSAETRIRRQTQANKLKDGCVFVQVCAYVCLWCNYDCQTRAYWATWSHINREIIVSYSCTGRDKNRDTEDQMGSESSTMENHSDIVLLWSAGVNLYDRAVWKTEKSDWMILRL